MKTLYQILLEGATATKFDLYVSTFEELRSTCKELRVNSEKYDFLNEFWEDVVKVADYKPTEFFIYAVGAQYFKVPYALGSAIKQCIGQKYSDKLKFSESGKKIKVNSTDSKGVLFETGSGSIGRVSTAHQETATCRVWNAYVEAMLDNKEFDINNHEFIKNLVSDITSEFDSEWISTFQKQVICIVEYLKSIDRNPLEYRLFRYDDGSKIGNAYKTYISSYVSVMKGKKDNFDPADVIAYHKDSEAYIIGKLKKYSNTPVESKELYIKDLFNMHLIKGISLKKIPGSIKSAKYDIYNVGAANKCEKVISFTYTPKPNYITVVCKGDFNFDNITDSEGNEIGSERVVELVMRSFGSGQTGVDCTLKETRGSKAPTLGKCPTRYWREILNCKDENDLQSYLAKFKEVLETLSKEEICTKLENMIKGAIKEGPHCFPFILIH